MAITVVGLFERRDEAEAARRDLAAAGFAQGDIELHDGRASSGLHNELRDRGIPERDAQLYASGVGSGDSLVLARTDDAHGDRAQAILNRHGALDIYDAHTVRTDTVTTAAAAPAVATAATVAATHAHAPATPPIASPTPATALHTATTDRTVAAGETVTVPVVEEHLAVGKRQIKRGGALIHTHVEQVPVSEQVTLRDEEVVVERHAVNRPVSQADLSGALQDRTIAVTETDEVAVVAKEARVVEEVTVGKQATERVETVRDTVRRTEVDVDEIETDLDVRETTRAVR